MALAFVTIFPNMNPDTLPTHHLSSPPNTFPLPIRVSKTQSNDGGRFTTAQRIRFPAATIHASFGESPPLVAPDSGGGNLDAFLSTFELISLASSALVSVYFAVRCGLQKGGGCLGLLGGRIAMWQCLVLASGLAAGAAIRRRQWRSICSGVRFSRGPASYGASNMLERVERLEEDVRASSTIVQALARRLEKLGIRFRVTRKTLKEPIAEIAALAQKNSEATRALAAQNDVLENELGEIQKVILAMQEQQQKQLELLLAIGKAGNLFETKRVKNQHKKADEKMNSPIDNAADMELNRIKSQVLQEDTTNSRH